MADPLTPLKGQEVTNKEMQDVQNAHNLSHTDVHNQSPLQSGSDQVPPVSMASPAGLITNSSESL